MSQEWLQERYQIIRPLNQGGMGTVYLARDHQRFRRYVAIKKNTYTQHSASAQWFEREAAILVALDHVNLPKVHAFFTDPFSGHQHLVMDYIEGENLHEILERAGPLDEATALTWLLPVMRALHYMHSYTDAAGSATPILHLDIKPENIILRGQDQQPFLVDFGLANNSQATAPVPRGGTKGYTPPEQYEGTVDVRTDIYALGATLYKLLTGETPTPSQERQAGVRLEKPRRFRPQISRQTQRVIWQALALDPDKRYQSVRAMHQALYTPHRDWSRLFVLLGLLMLIAAAVWLGTNPGVVNNWDDWLPNPIVWFATPSPLPTPNAAPTGQGTLVGLWPHSSPTPADPAGTPIPPSAQCDSGMALITDGDTSFCFDRYEVSNGNYLTCVAAGICSPVAPEDRYIPWLRGALDDTVNASYPIVNVTWAQADAYCTHYRKARLPTWNEWMLLYSRLEHVEGAEGSNRMEPVDHASLRQTAGDLYGIAANVREWVEDARFLGGRLVRRGIPIGPSSLDPNDFLAAIYREKYTFTGDDLTIERKEDWGFRCAATITPGAE